ncbi:hypothetical protein [Endozoicomonas acroporae]|uniref:hypothetical protein n=1 Tax=Endozoicomonas acroporae TaxID=1701104 RepID=UPI003D795B84
MNNNECSLNMIGLNTSVVKDQSSVEVGRFAKVFKKQSTGSRNSVVSYKHIDEYQTKCTVNLSDNELKTPLKLCAVASSIDTDGLNNRAWIERSCSAFKSEDGFDFTYLVKSNNKGQTDGAAFMGSCQFNCLTE